MKSLLKSFIYAIHGIFACLEKERNMRIHTVCMIYMYFFLCAFDFFEITGTQLAVIFIANGLVMGGELINTAVERAVDLHGSEYTENGRIAKDCAAGAVLIFALFSVLCGVSILYQPSAFKAMLAYFIANPVAIVLFAVSVIVFTVFIFKGFPKKKG